MAESGKAKCHSSFNSCYEKSSLFLLYGGMRKSLFINAHPTNGVSSKNIGLKVGKSFFDFNKQQLEYKDENWRVKANFGGTQLFNMKMKIGDKRKGVTRNNVQFGTDQSHFGSDNKSAKLSIGGMFSWGNSNTGGTTRLKIFSDEAAEVFSSANVAGVKLACDMRLTYAVPYSGFFGASYGLPSSVPFFKNVHVGGVVSLPDMRPSMGLFAQVPVESVKKAIVGVELFDVPQPSAALFGAEVALNAENSVIVKTGDNGIAHVSLIKHFKDVDVRMGIEANLLEGAFGKFGATVTLKV